MIRPFLTLFLATAIAFPALGGRSARMPVYYPEKEPIEIIRVGIREDSPESARLPPDSLEHKLKAEIVEHLNQKLASAGSTIKAEEEEFFPRQCGFSGAKLEHYRPLPDQTEGNILYLFFPSPNEIEERSPMWVITPKICVNGAARSAVEFSEYSESARKRALECEDLKATSHEQFLLCRLRPFLDSLMERTGEGDEE